MAGYMSIGNDFLGSFGDMLKYSAYQGLYNPASMSMNPINPMGMYGMMPSMDMYGTMPSMNMYGMMPMDMYGMNPYMYGGMNPYMGSMISKEDYQKLQKMTFDERQEYLAELQNKQNEIQIERNEKLHKVQAERITQQAQYSNSYQSFQTAAVEMAVKLKFLIMENRKDEIIPAYNEYLNKIAEIPQNKIRVKENGEYVEKRMPEEALRRKALEMYQQVHGTDFLQDVDNELAGPYMQGIKRVLSFGLADKIDSSDIKAHVMGVKPDSADSFARGAGVATATAATATTTVISIPFLLRLLSKFI